MIDKLTEIGFFGVLWEIVENRKISNELFSLLGKHKLFISISFYIINRIESSISPSDTLVVSEYIRKGRIFVVFLMKKIKKKC
jgi:hypothetical protein